MRIFSQACRHYIWCAYYAQATTGSVPAQISENPMSANRHLLDSLRARSLSCVKCSPQSLDGWAIEGKNPVDS